MLPKVGLDPKAFASIAGNMKGTYVRGPGGNNAVPGMMMRWLARQAIIKIMRLAYIDRFPRAIWFLQAKNVDTGSDLIGDPNRIELGLVLSSTCPAPDHAGRNKKHV